MEEVYLRDVTYKHEQLCTYQLFPGPGRAGDLREIDWEKSPLGQRFDRQLYPARRIDNFAFLIS